MRVMKSNDAYHLITDHDLYLFNEGSHFRLYDKLGAQLQKENDVPGVRFTVWAPNADFVSIIGDFNNWNHDKTPLYPLGQSGLWSGFVSHIGAGYRYKYFIRSQRGGYTAQKADPFAFTSEVPPKSASVVWYLDYQWKDTEWMATQAQRNALNSPMSIYEVHLGSWARVPEEGHRFLTYQEIAPKLSAYVRKMGFTHVELLPIMEHPFYASWGYQTTGYFAPSSRYGTPQDFMALVDHLHQNGIGVILDWVPSHFPTDGHGLGFFDGTHLYEHEDARLGYHPDWKSAIFNYGRHEVQSFLISSAMYWLDKYHIDGLRVDAVASMLYLDYSRKDGEWLPNKEGGRENWEAVQFLKRMNEEIYKTYPGVQTIAEESTAWPMVSRPTYARGLGFGLKWDMGWMHDSLRYFSRDPVHRAHHHNDLTFRLLYAWNENFVLPLSHDEVVHGKGSLVGKMPGDDWQKFSNLRLLYGAMYGMSGKKLMFMGAEFGQRREWSHDSSLEWHVAERPFHRGVQKWVSDLNHLYRKDPALFKNDFDPSGFQWVDCNDVDHSVASFLRHGGGSTLLVVGNFTPVPREGYRVGVPESGFWKEVLNSDSTLYDGSGWGNQGGVSSEPIPWQGQPHSVMLSLPPLGILFLKRTSF